MMRDSLPDCFRTRKHVAWQAYLPPVRATTRSWISCRNASLRHVLGAAFIGRKFSIITGSDSHFRRSSTYGNILPILITFPDILEIGVDVGGRGLGG